MSATANLNSGVTEINDGYDSIIITDYFQGKRGGVTLDYTDYTRDYIRAGHVIIKETGVADSHKPMPITGEGASSVYGTLPVGHEYYGFAVNTSYAGEVANGIAVRGNLNPKVGANTGAAELGYFNVTPLIAAIKAALPTFTFLGDDD